MNTTNEPSPLSHAPLPTRATLRRRLTGVVIGLSLPLLAACSSDADSPPIPGSVAPTIAATSTTDAASAPTLAASGDAFCDLTVQEQSNSADLAEAMAGYQDLFSNVATGTAPVADLNAWGSTLYDIAGRSGSYYGDAAPFVVGTEVESDFAEMQNFFVTYSVPLAQMARDASAVEAFTADVGALVQMPDVQASMTAAPTAAQNVTNYVKDRCPAVG